MLQEALWSLISFFKHVLQNTADIVVKCGFVIFHDFKLHPKAVTRLVVS